MRKVEYIEMFEFALLSIGAVISVGIILSAIDDWREKRKARKTIKQMTNRYYAEMAQDAVKEAEEFLRESGKR